MKLLPHLPSPSPRPRPARHDPRRVTCHGQFPRRTWRRASLYTLLSSCKTTENTRVSSHGAGAMSHSTGGSHLIYIAVPGLLVMSFVHLSTYINCFHISVQLLFHCRTPYFTHRIVSFWRWEKYIDATSICDEILQSQNCKL